MIVKKVPAKKATKSSYKALANYILDKSNDMEKVESYWFTNCSYTEIDHNVLEIENMQQLNQRAKQDKTYHLIVLFQEDENPNDEIIQNIENELLKSIGLEDCQRLSVIHNNTNHKHIHIAVNLVDPLTLKMKNLSFDKLTLQRKAAELEKKHNLKITNHLKTTNEPKEKKIDDKTIHTGVINFKDWVKETALEDIKTVIADDKSTWKDFYTVFAKYDLELRDRANGYVISSRSRKLFIKASDVHRELSKAKLDKRYGFRDKSVLKAFIAQIEPKYKFELKPNLGSNLWDEYRQVEKQKELEKIKLLDQEKFQREETKAKVLKKWQLYREKTMKDRTISRTEKQKIYKMISISRKNELNNIQSKFKDQRMDIFSQHRKLSYKDFLMNKSLAGDEKALELLRKKETKTKQSGNTIGKETESNHKVFNSFEKRVSKDGVVSYILDNESRVLDKGDHFKINIKNNRSQEILTVLKMAIAKYGNELDITGTEDFKREVLKAAKEHNLNIKFKDEKMQLIRDIQSRKIGNGYSY